MTNMRPDPAEACSWAAFLYVVASVGVLARCTAPFDDLGVNIQFTRFGPSAAGFSVGMLQFECERAIAEKLAGQLSAIGDLRGLDLVDLTDTPMDATYPPGWTRYVSVPRTFDAIFDSPPLQPPLYARQLTRALRELMATPHDEGLPLAIASEAAPHIERLELENMLLLHSTETLAT